MLEERRLVEGEAQNEVCNPRATSVPIGGTDTDVYIYPNSSARNYFTYQRGTIESYSRWASEVGDSSYEFTSLLPYFQKSADFTPPNNSQRAANASVSYNPSAFISGAGPLQVSIPIFANPFSSVAKTAFLQLGFSTALDFVSGSLFGVQYNMNTIDPNGQTRSSSQTSFLDQAINVTKIQVYKGTLAKKIVFDGHEARGVLVNTNGTEYTLHARKEVVLSAGAVRLSEKREAFAQLLI